ncbi:hypothetical protein LDENG_00151650 [Lucifuga dentata]|nr:hypothetical protein LDENG_00151650 [Lucifuga dentata]
MDLGFSWVQTHRKELLGLLGLEAQEISWPLVALGALVISFWALEVLGTSLALGDLGIFQDLEVLEPLGTLALEALGFLGISPWALEGLETCLVLDSLEISWAQELLEALGFLGTQE